MAATAVLEDAHAPRTGRSERQRAAAWHRPERAERGASRAPQPRTAREAPFAASADHNCMLRVCGPFRPISRNSSPVMLNASNGPHSGPHGTRRLIRDGRHLPRARRG